MKTLEEINSIREAKRKELDLRVNTNADTREKHILVCHGTGCTSSKSPQILENFRKIIEEKNIENVRVIKTGCFGLCAKGPIVIIRPEDVFYAMVKPEDCEEIIEKHIQNGEIVERLLCKDVDNSVVKKLDELTFYKKQKRIALKNCGVINPEDIEEYIAFDGYKALAKVLTEMSQDEVIDVISNSGLRGRGGAGFPTGKKWELTKAACTAIFWWRSAFPRRRSRTGSGRFLRHFSTMRRSGSTTRSATIWGILRTPATTTPARRACPTE